MLAGFVSDSSPSEIADKQGLLADVSPPKTERFTGTKTGVGENGDERRVARVEP
jgi:hypothetical protein